MKYREDIKRLKPLLIAITYFVFLIFVVVNFNSIIGWINKFLRLLTPFFYGIGIAFVLNIPMRNCEAFIVKHTKPTNYLYKRKRGISILFAIIVMFSLIGLFMSIIVPQLIITIGNLINNLARYLNSLLTNINQVFEFLHLDPLEFKINGDLINEVMKSVGVDVNNLSTTINNVLSGISSAGFSIVNNIGKFVVTLGNWFMGFMLSIYLLGSKETFIRQMKKIVASIFRYDICQEILEVSSKINEIFNNFISGQLLEALIIGGLIYIALWIFKMPFAILIGAVASVMALVPVFGPTLACCIGFILVLSVSPIKAVLFVIIYQTVQQIENTVIYPKVVGNSVGLPGIWTLLSIVVFGGLFGVIGMLLAVPFTACMYTFGSLLVNRSLRKKRLIVTDDVVKQENDE
ncbi:MAG: AI-2E family transporter [Erysipelotrichaceae bacterium]|nr:AI-2E family transporter [Erysipelotrichaceae bacterium]MDY5252603.1 AI-2E family transporter [Erysipelotrichaceae bacterium]